MRNRLYNQNNLSKFSDLEKLKTVSLAIFIFALLSVVLWTMQQPRQVEPPHWVMSNLGDVWYGVYVQGRKTGYMQANWSYAERESVYRYRQHMHVRRPGYGVGAASNKTVIWTFAAQPPYRLKTYTEQHQFGDNKTALNLQNTKTEAQVSRQQAGTEYTQMIASLNYTLTDFLATERWLQKRPAIHDSISFNALDTEHLALRRHQATLQQVNADKYTVRIVGNDGIQHERIIDNTGNAIQIDLSTLLSMRRESLPVAKAIENPLNSFEFYQVTVDKPLGDPALLESLVLAVNHLPQDVDMNAPGQRLLRNGHQSLLEIQAPSRAPVTVTTASRQLALNETAAYPISHPEISRRAKLIISDPENPYLMIKELVNFVHYFIRYDEQATPLNVLDVIKQRRGDCSEYALLFTTLARSLGLPTRTVNGLIYLGDEKQAFGLHSWNEVAIDGVWLPVDPTWNEIPVNATHIRFPNDAAQTLRLHTLLPTLKFTVRQTSPDSTLTTLDANYSNLQ